MAGRGQCEVAYIVCPYYHTTRHRELKYIIRCEGCVSEVSVIHPFPTAKAYRSHIAKYCATHNYGRCPYAQYKDRLYGISKDPD